MLVSGCGPGQLATDRDELYDQAVEASLADSPQEAARAAYRYMDRGSVDDPRYDRAALLLADNLAELELTYPASLWYHEIASQRRDVALLEDAVMGLADIVEEYPHDDWTLIDGFIGSSELGGLSTEAQAFVEFYRGWDNLRRGRDKWARQHFEEIPSDHPYQARARYLWAVDRIADYDLEEATEQLEGILEDFDGELSREIENDIQRTLARLAFETRQFEEAIERYSQLRGVASDDPQLLLEMAWAEFYRDDHRRSLGLLLALDAPEFQGLIAPERYVLEALNLQALCQYEPARTAAARLRAEYGDAIDDLRRGVPVRHSEALMEAARLREATEAVASYRARLKAELQLVDTYERQFGPGLTQALREWYGEGIAEADRREQERLADEVRRVAGELVEADEGIQLVMHEISVSLLRGGGAAQQTAEEPIYEVPRSGPDVYYRFIGEYWTDEIDDLIVPLEDRCID